MSRSESPTPLVAFRYIADSVGPVTVRDTNAMRSPLGDQTGERFCPPVVKRVSVPRTRSRSEMSAPPPLTVRVNATVFSSGEIVGVNRRPVLGASTGVSILPLRSNQTIWFTPPAASPLQYKSTPDSEAVTGA